MSSSANECLIHSTLICVFQFIYLFKMGEPNTKHKSFLLSEQGHENICIPNEIGMPSFAV